MHQYGLREVMTTPSLVRFKLMPLAVSAEALWKVYVCSVGVCTCSETPGTSTPTTTGAAAPPSLICTFAVGVAVAVVAADLLRFFW